MSATYPELHFSHYYITNWLYSKKQNRKPAKQQKIEITKKQ